MQRITAILLVSLISIHCGSAAESTLLRRNVNPDVFAATIPHEEQHQEQRELKNKKNSSSNNYSSKNNDYKTTTRCDSTSEDNAADSGCDGSDGSDGSYVASSEMADVSTSASAANESGGIGVNFLAWLSGAAIVAGLVLLVTKMKEKDKEQNFPFNFAGGGYFAGLAVSNAWHPNKSSEPASESVGQTPYVAQVV